MIVGIIGSREFNDYDYLRKIALSVDIDTIVSGGARGADSLAARYAADSNIPLIEYKPNWDLHGKSAGYIRNKLIVEKSDLIIAFWDDKSRGTKHSIDIATKSQKKLIIAHYTTRQVEFINM